MRYIKDTGADRYDDILDFANMVFSMEYSGIDFADSFPKAYGDGDGNKPTHHYMLDDETDRIRALIGTYPITLSSDANNINADYIGTVAVHPRYRNEGLFSVLMEKVEKDAILNGKDLLILDGDRGRYGRFGYEPAGIKYIFTINFNGADHQPVFCFEEVDGESDHIGQMYNLYKRRNVCARNRGNFYCSLLSLKSTPYAVLKNNNVVGYVNVSEDGQRINEFEIEDMDDIYNLLMEVMDGFDIQRLTVTVGSDEVEKIRRLERISEAYSLSTSHQIKILNYEKVTEFLLGWKSKFAKITDGEYHFAICQNHHSTNYCINVANENISVARTDTKANDTFSGCDFVKMLTTPAYYTFECGQTPAGWFPLPFFLPDADTF